EGWEDIEDFGETHLDFLKQYGDFENGIPVHDTIARVVSCIIVCDVPDELIDFTFEWKGLKKLCVAVSFRSIIAEQKKELEMTVRYYISSADLTAEKFATAIRNHWHVENKLHWRLDVVMNEDDCKIRRGNAAELFSGIRHIAINKDVIAIDGKTLRHSYDKSRRRGAIHVISAFSTMHSLVIGQIKTDEKSNEITAIPELLNMLDIKGKIITTDAMGCQKDIAEKIQKQGGDYLFAVKGNQGRLNKAFEEKFPLKELNNPEHDSYAISEKSHGREEIRLHIVCD
ncbi:ISAs1 family transposase, partial [Escherichia coli]|uniref:ISAs1 family transposase n=1 Tax=Escherichia coli TaxID=562 RepID=UPI001C708C2F